MGNNREALKLYRSALTGSGNSFEKFMESFTADIPDLLNAGVKAGDIPVILDSLVYGMFLRTNEDTKKYYWLWFLNKLIFSLHFYTY